MSDDLLAGWRDLPLSEVQRYMIEGCLLRQDNVTAEKYLRDWGHGMSRMAKVSKFNPGEHYHVRLPNGEVEKFTSRADADCWIRKHNCVPGPLEEKFVYVREGD